jgi:hypothetical protein
MAGQGYRRWIPGEVITADNIQQFLMDQSVQRFADATARTTALTGYLAEGMLTYLDSTKSLEVFDGTDWVGIEPTNLDASVITSGTFNAARIPDLDASKITGTTLVVERLRGTSTGGMSLSSSTHALQTGLTDGANLAFDANEVQARNSGAAGTMSINRLGGDVDIGNTTTGMGIEGSQLWANGVYDNVLSTSFRSVFVSSTATRNKLGYVPSSRALKKNIQPLRYTAEQILAVEPVEFNYTSQADGDAKSAGFIAEELHDAGLTAFVSYDEEGKPASIHYEFFAVALQQVIRDQAARLSAIEARLDKLEK